MFRRTLPPFNYVNPNSLAEASSLLSKYKSKAKLLAGGTDLITQMKQRKAIPEYVIGLKGIPDLDYIQHYKNAGLRIGTLTTLQSLIDSPIIQQTYDFIAAAAKKMGPPQVKNMGTVGGNLCNAGPSADLPPSLLALDAKLRIHDSKDQKIINLSQFFQSPFKTTLNPAEILVEIIIPPPPPYSAGAYCWLTKVSEADETLVGAATFVITDSRKERFKEVRIGLCSVAPTPIRATQAEKALTDQVITDEVMEQAAAIAAREISPRSRADYRRQMTAHLVKKALSESIGKLK